MKNIFKVVLTGGPCAGKTTAMNKLMVELEQRDFKVIVVPEVPTELFKSGMLIGTEGVPNEIFQQITIESQLQKEAMAKKYAKNCKEDNVLIICDRGALDPKAYCNDDDYTSVLNSMDLNEIDLRDSYDAVFHMKTAADGAEEFYTTENNETRKETPQQARELDERTINAWVGHQKLRIIDNSTDFNDKLERLLSEVLCTVGLKPHKKVNKFLIEMPNSNNPLWKLSKRICLLQTYLDKNTSLRSRGCDNYKVYFLTKKKYNVIGDIEVTKRIKEKEYFELLNSGLKAIQKDRYCFYENGNYFKLNVYPLWNDKAILEVFSENEVNLPYGIKVIEDVTNKEEYKNSKLAER